MTTCHDTIVTKDKHVMEHVNYATELRPHTTMLYADGNTPNRKRRNAGISSQILKGGMHKTGERKGWFPYDRKRSQTIADRRRSRIVDRRRSQRVLFPYNRRRSQTIAEPTVAIHFVQRKCHMYSRVVPAGKSKQTTWRTSRRKFCCKQIYFFF